MTHFTKEQYDKKNEWASKRASQNKEITTLTTEQHDALELICRKRHELHSEAKGFFLSESSIYNEYDFYPAEWSVEETLISIIQENNLPDIKITLRDYDNWYNDRDYEEAGLTVEEAFDITYTTKEKIDQDIRNWLSFVDYTYDTNYAPSRGDCSSYIKLNPLYSLMFDEFGSIPDKVSNKPTRRLR